MATMSAAAYQISSAAFAQAVRTQKRRADIASGASCGIGLGAVSSAIGICVSLQVVLELAVFLVRGVHAACYIDVIESIVHPSSAQEDDGLQIMPLGIP